MVNSECFYGFLREFLLFFFFLQKHLLFNGACTCSVLIIWSCFTHGVLKTLHVNSYSYKCFSCSIPCIAIQKTYSRLSGNFQRSCLQHHLSQECAKCVEWADTLSLLAQLYLLPAFKANCWKRKVRPELAPLFLRWSHGVSKARSWCEEAVPGMARLIALDHLAH